MPMAPFSNVDHPTHAGNGSGGAGTLLAPLVATGSADGGVRVWNLDSFAFAVSAGPSAFYQTNSDVGVGGGRDRRFFNWRARSIATTAVRLSRDWRVSSLVVGSQDGTVKMFDCATGSLLSKGGSGGDDDLPSSFSAGNGGLGSVQAHAYGRQVNVLRCAHARLY